MGARLCTDGLSLAGRFIGRLMRALGGPRERSEIAERLGIEVQAVTNARKRLDRRLDEFGAGHPEYPRVFIEEMKRV